ncbi:MAG: hypothetical protein EP334_08455 [Gammaproteobacteria bacterium]|nr:MAG: hypothetical protein EP334_08455 [Gammaproteobacteria bacterium]
MKVIHNDTVKTTTFMTVDNPHIDGQSPTDAEDVLKTNTPAPKDLHDFREVAIYLDEIVLNSDLDWF